MSKIEVIKNELQFIVKINGLVHLALSTGQSAIHSYIDDDVEPTRYYIEFYLASGQTVKAEYDRRELWEEILKGL